MYQSNRMKEIAASMKQMAEVASGKVGKDSPVTVDWKEEALKLREKGLSSRKICKELGMRTSQKSTVNYFFARHDAEQALVNAPKICYLDIECTQMEGRFWGLFKTNISHKAITKHSYFLSYSYAVNDGEIVGNVLTPQEAIDGNDEVLIEELWHVLNNNDVLVGHNLRKFDSKKINTRFAYYGFPPPSPYKIIDTLEIAKKSFAFPSNRLEAIGMYLGIGMKAQTGGEELWFNCIAGDQEALDTILAYNKQDIVLTREVYKRLRAFNNGAVNIAVMHDNVGALCHCCGSDKIEHLDDKYTYTPNGKYKVFTCLSCGSKMRSSSRVGTGNKFVRVA